MAAPTSRKRAAFCGTILIGSVAVLAPAACGSPYGGGTPPLDVTDDDASPGKPSGEGGTTTTPTPLPDGATGLPECGAQRVVHIVAGNGGLAWVTLLWPVPGLISNPQAMDAYDDPTKAVAVSGTSATHPLYARKVDTRPLLGGHGAHPDPSVFVVGSNESHTQMPATATRFSSGTGVIAAGAAAQKVLNPKVAVIAFASLAGTYGTASGAPPLTTALNVGAAQFAVKMAGVTPTQEAALTASTTTVLTSWGVDDATLGINRDLAEKLVFTARAFELGLVGTVMIEALDNDPHGAFGDVPGTTATADSLTRIIDGFYAELTKANEPSCTHKGATLSLADNVVLIVSGDTPKNSFVRTNWADGSPGNANLLYARSNGYLVPGWFGQLTAAARTNFDPATGDPSNSATPADSTNGALGGVLYAISRGNKVYVGTVATSSYQGVLAPTAP